MDIKRYQTGRAPGARRSLDGFQVAAVSAPKQQPKQLRQEQSRPTAKRVAQKRPIQAKPVAEAVQSYPLPRYTAPRRPRKLTKHHMSKKLWALRLSGMLLIILLSTGGFLALKGYGKIHKIFRGTSIVAALSSAHVAPELLKGEGDGRVNILLMGVGGPGHDGPDLTDTLVVLSVDPVNNTATMLSIPRDLWVKMPVNYFGSTQKINAAYESGKYHYLGKMDSSNTNSKAVEAGFAAEDQVMSQVLGITINYHLLVNFQAFRQAIDTVGGVTVDVPTDLVDPTMAWENGNNAVLAKAGVQQMNGVKALLYARSRETTSDFARSQRQRQILVALKDKVLTAGTLANPTKIDGLLNAFGDNVFSDLSTKGASRLASIMKQVKDSKISSVSLVDKPHQLVTTDHVGTTSVVRPLAGFDSYTDIQSFVRSQLPDGYLVKEHASIEVVGQSTTSASATAAMLTNYGYSVAGSSVSALATNQPVVVDLSAGKDPYTLHYLERHYGVTAVKTLPVGITLQNPSAAFVIIGSK